MKYRLGFVSNSSSSSFSIHKEYLSEIQMDKIRKHVFYANEILQSDFLQHQEDEYHHIHDFGYFDSEYSGWDVNETPEILELSTSMNNFDMYEFISAIKVPREAIFNEWSS